MKWLERRANGNISQATKKIPLIEIEEERKHLRPLKNSIYRKNNASTREMRNVTDKCRISVDACQYDLPDKYRNQVVEIYKTENKLFIFDRYSGEEISEYSLSIVPGVIVKNRAAVREMGVKMGDLRREVLGYFTLEVWKVFLEANFRTFSRYTRDQCLEARRYFRNDTIDLEILEKALTYCIDNKTFSIKNLKDSYRHFIDLKKGSIEHSPVMGTLKVRTGEIKGAADLEVSKPDLEPYRALVSTIGGAQ
jgi:hypothetical protein